MLIEKFTSCEFFDYQITGAIGLVLKLFGGVDAKLLLSATGLNPQDPRAERVSSAAGKLRDLQIYGAMIADGTGFGKTKQCLLAALLFSFLTTENKPALLITPTSVIYQWLTEIQTHWLGGLHPILSHGRFSVDGVDELSRKEMAGLKFPSHLEYLLDQNNPEARKALIITSYETHKARTLMHVFEQVEDVSNQPTRIRKIRTVHSAKFGLLVADEAHKTKNKSTTMWALLSIQRFSNAIFATATPMFNAVRVSLIFRIPHEVFPDHKR